MNFHSMLAGSIPTHSVKYAYLFASTRVFPEPAPATTRTMPSVDLTSFACCVFSPLNSFSSVPCSIYSLAYHILLFTVI